MNPSTIATMSLAQIGILVSLIILGYVLFLIALRRMFSYERRLAATRLWQALRNR